MVKAAQILSLKSCWISRASMAAFRAWAILREHLEVIRAAAARRGEEAPAVDDIVDTVVAPIIHRILFTDADSESLGLERRLRQLLR